MGFKAYGTLEITLEHFQNSSKGLRCFLPHYRGFYWLQFGIMDKTDRAVYDGIPAQFSARAFWSLCWVLAALLAVGLELKTSLPVHRSGGAVASNCVIFDFFLQFLRLNASFAACQPASREPTGSGPRS